MNNANKAAFPSTDGATFATDGLTKREYFAGLAMQGIIAGRAGYGYKESDVAESAIIVADELLKQLDNGQ